MANGTTIKGATNGTANNVGAPRVPYIKYYHHEDYLVQVEPFIPSHSINLHDLDRFFELTADYFARYMQDRHLTLADICGPIFDYANLPHGRICLEMSWLGSETAEDELTCRMVWSSFQVVEQWFILWGSVRYIPGIRFSVFRISTHVLLGVGSFLTGQ